MRQMSSSSEEGGAGTAAALLARESGVRVILTTKLRHGDANTMMAEWAIRRPPSSLDLFKDSFRGY
jgi:succinate dehydrogenase/fumarate reductase flavoprotein subunit